MPHQQEFDPVISSMEELSSTFMLSLNSVIQVNHDCAPLTKHINTQTALRFGRANCQDKLNCQLPNTLSI